MKWLEGLLHTHQTMLHSCTQNLKNALTDSVKKRTRSKNRKQITGKPARVKHHKHVLRVCLPESHLRHVLTCVLRYFSHNYFYPSTITSIRLEEDFFFGSESLLSLMSVYQNISHTFECTYSNSSVFMKKVGLWSPVENMFMRWNWHRSPL